MAACSSVSSAPGSVTYHIVPLSVPAPYGHTWPEWSSRWLQWAVGLPPSHHPLWDTAPVDTCQSSPVWFLGGANSISVPTRTATVPYGTALLVNPQLEEQDTAFGVTSLDSLALFTLADWTAYPPTGTIAVDGNDIPNLYSYLIDTSRCVLVLPDSNLFGYPPGKLAACTMGYFVMIDSLSKGEHTIHLQGGTTAFHASINYKFTVR